MGNKHTSIARLADLNSGGHSGAAALIDAADRIAAPALAIAEIRALVDCRRENAVIPSRVIRQILKRHGL